MRTTIALGRVTAAAVLAGPFFCLSFVAADSYLRLPEPILLSPAELMSFILILPISTLAGFVPAYLLSAVGAAMMLVVSEAAKFAAHPAVWTLAGAAIGGAIAALLGGEAQGSFALVATSAVCARICHSEAQAD